MVWAIFRFRYTVRAHQIQSMKYFIKQKKLPFSEDHHDFTVTICLGLVPGDVESYEAKIQFPAESYRDGLAMYRRFVQEQKDYGKEDQRPRQITSTEEQQTSGPQAIALNSHRLV